MPISFPGFLPATQSLPWVTCRFHFYSTTARFHVLNHLGYTEHSSPHNGCAFAFLTRHLSWVDISTAHKIHTSVERAQTPWTERSSDFLALHGLASRCAHEHNTPPPLHTLLLLHVRTFCAYRTACTSHRLGSHTYHTLHTATTPRAILDRHIPRRGGFHTAVQVATTWITAICLSLGSLDADRFHTWTAPTAHAWVIHIQDLILLPLAFLEELEHTTHLPLFACLYTGSGLRHLPVCLEPFLSPPFLCIPTRFSLDTLHCTDWASGVDATHRSGTGCHRVPHYLPFYHLYVSLLTALLRTHWVHG